MQIESEFYGIDLGHKKAVIAKSILTQAQTTLHQNQRETEVMIGFRNNERVIGEQASLIYRTNVLTMIRGFNALLGYKVYTEQMLYFFPLVPNEDKKFPLKVPMSCVQLTASFLKHLCQNPFEQVVISYPDYFTEFEILDLLNAIKIAQINAVSVISECKAINNFYIMNKQVSGTTMFVDFGYQKFTAFVLGDNKLLCEVYDRELGTKHIDKLLFEWMIQQIQYDNKEKTKFKLLDYCENIRKTLSANNEYQIDIEMVNGGEDFVQAIKREQFEQIIQPVLNRIKSYLMNLAQQIQEFNIQISCIELLGGGSRIPAVQKMIQTCYPNLSVQKTLNATETISQGCAITGFMQSQNQDSFEHQLHYPIYIAITSNDPGFEGNEFSLLIKKKANKIIRFEPNLQMCNNAPEYYTLFYDPPISLFPSIIKTIKVQTINKPFKWIITQNRLVTIDTQSQINYYSNQINIEECSKIEQQLCAYDQQITQMHEQKYLYEKEIIKIEKDIIAKNLSIPEMQRLGDLLEEAKSYLNEKGIVDYRQLTNQLRKDVDDFFK